MNTICFNLYRRVRPASRQLPTMIIVAALLSVLPLTNQTSYAASQRITSAQPSFTLPIMDRQQRNADTGTARESVGLLGEVCSKGVTPVGGTCTKEGVTPVGGTSTNAGGTSFDGMCINEGVTPVGGTSTCP